MAQASIQPPCSPKASNSGGGWPRLAFSGHVRLESKFGCPVLAWLGRAMDGGHAPCLASETWDIILVILRNIAAASPVALGQIILSIDRSPDAFTQPSTTPDSPPAPPPRQRISPAPSHQRQPKVCPCGQHPAQMVRNSVCRTPSTRPVPSAEYARSVCPCRGPAPSTWRIDYPKIDRIETAPSQAFRTPAYPPDRTGFPPPNFRFFVNFSSGSRFR